MLQILPQFHPRLATTDGADSVNRSVVLFFVRHPHWRARVVTTCPVSYQPQHSSALRERCAVSDTAAAFLSLQALYSTGQAAASAGAPVVPTRRDRKKIVSSEGDETVCCWVMNNDHKKSRHHPLHFFAHGTFNLSLTWRQAIYANLDDMLSCFLVRLGAYLFVDVSNSKQARPER